MSLENSCRQQHGHCRTCGEAFARTPIKAHHQPVHTETFLLTTVETIPTLQKPSTTNADSETAAGADRADLQTGTGANAGREPVAREWDGLARNRREPPLTAARDGTINTEREPRSLQSFHCRRSLFGRASVLVPAAQSLLSFRIFGRLAAAPRRESVSLHKLKKVEKRRRPQTRRLRVETTLRSELPCDAILQKPRKNKSLPAELRSDDSGRTAESRSRSAVVNSVAEFSKHPKFQRCKT